MAQDKELENLYNSMRDHKEADPQYREAQKAQIMDNLHQVFTTMQNEFRNTLLHV